MNYRKLANEELDRLTPEEFKAAPKLPIVIVLDDVRSLYNVGSVFRTADAFRVTKIYLCGITAKPPHREIQKTALGATESVSWEYRKDILELLDELEPHHRILAIEQAENTTSIANFSPEPGLTYALVFGNEVKGVKQDVINRCSGVLEIPQFGTKHSLNIAVSIGIVLWEFWSKLNKS